MASNDPMGIVANALKAEGERLLEAIMAKEPTITGFYLGKVESYARYHEVGKLQPPRKNHLEIALDDCANAFIASLEEQNDDH